MTATVKTTTPFPTWTSSDNQKTAVSPRTAIIRSDQIAQANRFALVIKAISSPDIALPREEDAALIETWLPATENLLAAIWDNEEDAIYDSM